LLYVIDEMAKLYFEKLSNLLVELEIKKGYALFENPDDIEPKECKKYFVTSVAQA